MSDNKRQIVGPGKYVTFSYKLYNDANEELLFETPSKAPDEMVYGVSQEVVPGLASALKGLGKGDRFGIVLPPAVAFGDRSPEYELTLDPQIFMRDGKLAEEVKVGAALPMMTAEGYRIEGRVTEIGDKIKMDFNHPFAGMTVRYEGVVEDVREATPEELNPSTGCGSCGGGCGSCGSDSDSSGCCGGGCGGC